MSWVNPQGWPPGPARTRGHCVGCTSPFRHHPQKEKRDFLGGTVVKTLCFHCRGHGFHPWLGKIPHGSLAWAKKRKEGSPDTCHPPRHPFSLSLSLPILFISFPTKCSHPPHTYPTPHFSKHKLNPFPPLWIPSGSSQHHHCLLGKYSPSFFLVCNSARMHVRSLIWGVYVILPTAHIRFFERRLFCYIDC